MNKAAHDNGPAASGINHCTHNRRQHIPSLHPHKVPPAASTRLILTFSNKQCNACKSGVSQGRQRQKRCVSQYSHSRTQTQASAAQVKCRVNPRASLAEPANPATPGWALTRPHSNLSSPRAQAQVSWHRCGRHALVHTPISHHPVPRHGTGTGGTGAARTLSYTLQSLITPCPGTGILAQVRQARSRTHSNLSSPRAQAQVSWHRCGTHALIHTPISHHPVPRHGTGTGGRGAARTLTYTLQSLITPCPGTGILAQVRHARSHTHSNLSSPRAQARHRYRWHRCGTHALVHTPISHHPVPRHGTGTGGTGAARTLSYTLQSLLTPCPGTGILAQVRHARSHTPSNLSSPRAQAQVSWHRCGRHARVHTPISHHPVPRHRYLGTGAAGTLSYTLQSLITPCPGTAQVQVAQVRHARSRTHSNLSSPRAQAQVSWHRCGTHALIHPPISHHPVPRHRYLGTGAAGTLAYTLQSLITPCPGTGILAQVRQARSRTHSNLSSPRAQAQVSWHRCGTHALIHTPISHHPVPRHGTGTGGTGAARTLSYTLQSLITPCPGTAQVSWHRCGRHALVHTPISHHPVPRHRYLGTGAARTLSYTLQSLITPCPGTAQVQVAEVRHARSRTHSNLSSPRAQAQVSWHRCGTHALVHTPISHHPVPRHRYLGTGAARTLSYTLQSLITPCPGTAQVQVAQVRHARSRTHSNLSSPRAQAQVSWHRCGTHALIHTPISHHPVPRHGTGTGGTGAARTLSYTLQSLITPCPGTGILAQVRQARSRTHSNLSSPRAQAQVSWQRCGTHALVHTPISHHPVPRHGTGTGGTGAARTLSYTLQYLITPCPGTGILAQVRHTRSHTHSNLSSPRAQAQVSWHRCGRHARVHTPISHHPVPRHRYLGTGAAGTLSYTLQSLITPCPGTGILAQVRQARTRTHSNLSSPRAQAQVSWHRCGTHALVHTPISHHPCPGTAQAQVAQVRHARSRTHSNLSSPRAQAQVSWHRCGRHALVHTPISHHPVPRHRYLGTGAAGTLAYTLQSLITPCPGTGILAQVRHARSRTHSNLSSPVPRHGPGTGGTGAARTLSYTLQSLITPCPGTGILAQVRHARSHTHSNLSSPRAQAQVSWHRCGTHALIHTPISHHPVPRQGTGILAQVRHARSRAEAVTCLGFNAAPSAGDPTDLTPP
ncbi:hypothetical protein NDU88_000347 [Pleurodeles waltl]|uniref:Uncharacterized protein n=1 Tax=Pleurodeles waltl TaxID=8319 RepID=A0AAV7LZZ8_PLEWA|nr:hypothetical protein NDU88_000347 [Pleurodeles waltl]